jgi:hypothetical protein
MIDIINQRACQSWKAPDHQKSKLLIKSIENTDYIADYHINEARCLGLSLFFLFCSANGIVLELLL